MGQLCGNCANDVAAISPMGEVWPCVFSRWMPSGNVLDCSLAEVLDGGLRENRRRLREQLCRPMQCQPTQP
ncbi:MAG: SPASM domain-containing protein [Pseudonocardiaceae bacterium]